MPDPAPQAYVPATKPVTRDEVFDACNRLQAAGIKVTQAAVREALGKRGSMATISPLMRDWRASLDLLADDDEVGGGSTEAAAAGVDPSETSERSKSPDEELRSRVADGRIALTVKDYEERRSELTTQVHAQVERYFRELITIERTAATNAARLEEREAAAKAMHDAEKVLKEAAAAEIEASVKRERERAHEALTQERRVASAQRTMWSVVAVSLGILVGGGGVYLSIAARSTQQAGPSAVMQSQPGPMSATASHIPVAQQSPASVVPQAPAAEQPAAKSTTPEVPLPTPPSPVVPPPERPTGDNHSP